MGLFAYQDSAEDHATTLQVLNLLASWPLMKAGPNLRMLRFQTVLYITTYVSRLMLGHRKYNDSGGGKVFPILVRDLLSSLYYESND